MTRSNHAAAIFAAVILSFCFSTLGQAAVPDIMSYQGFLTDPAGSPINADTEITFSIYNVPSGGGGPLWTVTKIAPVDQGLFSVVLGTDVPFPLSMLDTAVWLGIAVGADAEMLPRRALTSAAFALKADDALTLTGQSAATLNQSAHVTDLTNPHGVTTTQTGAADAATLGSHTSDTTNPHSVTDVQSGAASNLASHTSDDAAHHTQTTTLPWTEVSNRPAGLDDGDDVGITSETDPQVGTNTTNYVPRWDGSALVAGSISDNGNVGIGLTTPAYKLHVLGSNNSTLGAFVNNNDTGSGPAYGILATGDARDSGIAAARGGTFTGLGGIDGGTAFGSVNQAKAYGNGNAIGVFSDATLGTSSGPQWAFLGYGDVDVEGGARIQGEVDIQGDVGIGTTTPGAKLDVVSTSGNNNARIKSGGTDSVAYLDLENDAMAWRLQTHGLLSDSLIFTRVTGGFLDVLTLKTDGDVGIGTTNPGYKLDVNGPINGTSVLVDGTPVGTSTDSYWSSAGGGDIRYLGGNVGIGTSPFWLYKLNVSGQVYCSGGCISSSREVKDNIRDLEIEDALATLSELRPTVFTLKYDGEQDVGFIAEDVPELVAKRGRKGLDAMDIVAVLTKVVQTQQEQIESLREEIGHMR